MNKLLNKPLKKLSPVLICLCLFCLTGCSRYYAHFVRFEQRIMVQLVGIDFENGEYGISIQFSVGKSSDASETENDLKTVTAKGENLYKAVCQARDKIGKEFFFEHTQVIFLGEGVLNSDTNKTIHEYLEYCDNNSTAYIAGVYGKAEELLALTFKDEYSDKNKLLLVVENAKVSGIFPACVIYETQIGANSKSGSFFIPMVRVEETTPGESGMGSSGGESGGGDSGGGESGGGDSGGGDSGGGSGGGETPESEVVPDGGALIIDGKIATYLDKTQCQGLALLVNSCDYAAVEFVPDGADNQEVCSLKLLYKKVKIIPKFDGENLTFRVKISAIANESYNPILASTDDAFIKPAQKAVEEKLKSCVNAVTALGGDLFNLEDTLKHRDYAAWLKAEDNWRETIKTAEFKYSIDVDII